MPPRTAMKVNCLVMRYLHFESVRGDLQEGYFALLDANFLSSWCQFPFSRAQNRHFCAREVCAGGCSGRATRVVLLGSCSSGSAAPARGGVARGGCCSGCGAVYLLAARSAKSSFLKVAASVKSSAYMPAAMAPSTLAGLSSVKRHSEALSPNFWQSRS